MFWKHFLKAIEIFHIGAKEQLTASSIAHLYNQKTTPTKPNANPAGIATGGGGRKYSSGGESECVPSKSANLDKVNHTGQIWSKTDYRNVRFLNSMRYVNENWPMKLGHKQKTFKTHERVVSCNGGDGALGHPVVYYNLDQPGYMHCFYCGRTFLRIVHKGKNLTKHTTHRVE